MDQHANASRYEIYVGGILSERLLSAFPELHARGLDRVTVLVGDLPDQAALHGVLSRIESLGLELLEVRRTRTQPETALEPDKPGAPASKRVGDSAADSEDGSSD